MISKSRNDTPQETTVVPPRAIQTSQEVNLYLEVLPYVAPDTATATKEALELLSSSNLGVDSKIGSGDWWGLSRRRLDLLEESGDWNQVWKECEELLRGVETKAKEKANGEVKNEETAVAKTDGIAPAVEGEETKGRGDDWRVWEGFVKSAGELYNQENKSQGTKALEVILSHRIAATAGTVRNADLALVKFASLFHDHHEGPEGTPTLLEACKEYFTRTGTKSCCFEDLQNYLEMLETSEKAEFLVFVENHVADMDKDDEVLEDLLKSLNYHVLTQGFYQKSKIAKVAAQINHHKFIYLLNISPLSTTSPTTEGAEGAEDIVPKLNDFITATLRIYSSALSLGSALLVTDNQYGDDAALLSVMGLVRLHLLHVSTTGSATTIEAQAPLYQSITILSTVVSKSKHNYQAMLLLVRLYLLIGAVGLAVDVYPGLNIKQIQNDTLSHFLLTRISTLLPAERKVEQILNEAGRIYESSSSQTPNMLVLAFERSGYAQMMGFLEFSERVAGSVCRSMWEIERRRVERLRTSTSIAGKVEDSETLENAIKDDAVIWDNRDFGVVVSCETEHPPRLPAKEGEEKGEEGVKQRFEELFRTSLPPGENWVKAFGVVEKAVVFCKAAIAAGSEVTAAVLEPENCVGVLEKVKADKEADVEFTDEERDYVEAATHFVAAVQAAVAKDGDKAKSAMEKATEWFTTHTPSSDNNNNNTDWHTLHALHLNLDVALLVTGYLAPCLTSTTFKPLQKALKPTLTELIAVANKFKGVVVEIAKKTAKSIDEEEGSDREQELVDKVLEMEKGDVGRLLRDLDIFGGVERVVEGVRKVRASLANAIAGSLEK